MIEPNKPTGWQIIKAMLFVIVTAGLATALYFYFSEPLEPKPSISGSSYMMSGSFTYESRKNFAFILGFVIGGIFGAIVAPPLVAVRTRNFFLLTLYGFIAGAAFFAIYYGYQLSWIHSTWSDAHTIGIQTDASFYAALHVIFICTGIGMLTSLAKRISMK